MYDIRQFKPVLYVLLALGLSGFALAAQSPGTFALSMSGLGISAWLIKTRRFSPIPHWLANLITVCAFLVLGEQVKADRTRTILVIGEFLVILQLVKVYEQRGNRDYAQLLILSLLLMVAASINTASLLFGLMLIVYLFLSLFCCLLFHLKIETDYARAAIGIPEQDENPATLRQDQHYLSRSMRRLTAAIAAVAIIMAIAVFLSFPRGAGEGLLGPLQMKQSQSLSGFSDNVSFQRIAQISQNNAPIAFVKLFKDGKLVRGGDAILLRGVVLNQYTGDDSSLGPRRVWQRTKDDGVHEVDHDLRLVSSQTRWRQEVTLLPTGTPYLFAMPGAFRLSDLKSDIQARYYPRDAVLQMPPDALQQQITYTVESDGHVMRQTPTEALATVINGIENPTTEPVLTKSSIDPIVETYARDPRVSGSDSHGALAARRNKLIEVDPLDPIIAQNICNYLKTNFTYTLDLRDAANIGTRDPLIAFLTDFKRGHCEYFAGSMTLMCQSLGMQARVVAGFKCDQYNTIMDQYSVLQSHAHTWVEVLSPSGEWLTFDPTSGRGDDVVAPATGVWRKSQQFLEYLQYTWANSVVAYDAQSRANLITNVDSDLTNTAINSQVKASALRDWLADHENIFESRVSAILIFIMVLLIVAAILFFLFERWQLRKKAKRIGVETLPASDQARLLRQLGFYDDLLKLLERHRIIRPKHLTPLEFSQSIDFLPQEMFDIVRRLTLIFYEVRYGRRELSAGQRKHLGAVIARVSETLGKPVT